MDVRREELEEYLHRDWALFEMESREAAELVRRLQVAGFELRVPDADGPPV
jgi:hypothetical protein